MRIKLRVFSALSEDIHNGWVWLLESIINSRTIIKLLNPNNKKSIYCEAPPIGKNFIQRYNNSKDTTDIKDPESCLVINEWYREKLKIRSTQTDNEFEITKAGNLYGQLRASLEYPQIVVRLSVKIALLSIILAIIGVLK